MEYVLNNQSKKAHIKPTQEICNADQIKARSEDDSLPAGYVLCRHCQKRAGVSV